MKALRDVVKNYVNDDLIADAVVDIGLLMMYSKYRPDEPDGVREGGGVVSPYTRNRKEIWWYKRGFVPATIQMGKRADD